MNRIMKKLFKEPSQVPRRMQKLMPLTAGMLLLFGLSGPTINHQPIGTGIHLLPGQGQFPSRLLTNELETNERKSMNMEINGATSAGTEVNPENNNGEVQPIVSDDNSENDPGGGNSNADRRETFYAPEHIADAINWRGFLELIRSETGKEISQQEFDERQRENEVRMEMSQRIAHALQRQDIPAFRQDRLVLVGLCTGTVIEVPLFRNINFIPHVAARNRKGTLYILEYFIERNPFCRMFTVTNGPPTTLARVREDLSAFHSKFSRMNDRPFMQRAGMQCVFRSTELGNIHRGPEGELGFSLHAHIIMQPTRLLTSEEWAAFHQSFRSYWRNVHVWDGQQIHMARAACRYIVKTQDLEGLRDEEFAELYRQTVKCHFVQPMGSFRELVRDCKSGKLKPTKVKGNGGYRWELTPNINSILAKGRNRSDSGSGGGSIDLILAITRPGYLASNRSEPFALVRGYSGEDFFDNNPLAREIRDAVRIGSESENEESHSLSSTS